MVELEEVLSGNESARKCDVDYGSNPLNVLLEREKQKKIEECLKVLLKELNPLQRMILLRTWQGYRVKEIAEEVNRDHATIIGCRRSISKRLKRVADENELERLGKTLNECKKGSRYAKALKEYKRRSRVRTALKELKEELTEAAPIHCRGAKTVCSTYLFERLMSVSGGREKQGCRLRRYLGESFGDEKTVCSLCKKCKAI